MKLTIDLIESTIKNIIKESSLNDLISQLREIETSKDFLESYTKNKEYYNSYSDLDENEEKMFFSYTMETLKNRRQNYENTFTWDTWIRKIEKLQKRSPKLKSAIKELMNFKKNKDFGIFLKESGIDYLAGEESILSDEEKSILINFLHDFVSNKFVKFEKENPSGWYRDYWADWVNTIYTAKKRNNLKLY